MTAALDWPAMMRAGIGGLGLSPNEFWDLTPGELLVLLGPETGAAPLGRSGLEALIAQFPDTPDSSAETEKE